MNALENLVVRLEAIAKKNEDRFGYRLVIEPDRRGRKLLYRFEAEELVDGHIIVDGTGSTIEEAVTNATESIDESCERWGYIQPEEQPKS